MLTAEGDSWQVKICAVANGASATIAHLLDTGGDCSMRMVLAELLTIDAYKTADGWKWSTVGDYSPPPLFDNEVQELIALGLVAHHDGVLTLTPKGRRIATAAA